MNERNRSKEHEHECPTCLGVHDEAIHSATMSIHLWLREQVAYRTMTIETPA